MLYFLHISIYENSESVFGSQSKINGSLIFNFFIEHCILVDLNFLYFVFCCYLYLFSLSFYY